MLTSQNANFQVVDRDGSLLCDTPNKFRAELTNAVHPGSVAFVFDGGEMTVSVPS